MEQIRPYVLPVVLAAGTMFAWYNTFILFNNFFVYHDSILQVKNVVPNPLFTPCFYGSVAFLVALVWAIVLAIHPHEKGSVWLSRFLLFGVCFAALVLAYEALEFYKIFSFVTSFSCSPGTHPLQTPCFGGLLFFLASYVVSTLINKMKYFPERV